MLTFIRGDSTFLGPGEIYVQLLPSGDPVELTHDGRQKMSPVFSPDGTRIAYTVFEESSEWTTWTVPVLGGEPQLLLANASGLQWLRASGGPSRVVYSELTGRGIQMALATSSENRLEPRRIYVPAQAGMAHRSFVSPDGQWVLVVEMERGWLPCRLLPWDGSSVGRPIGPSAAPCTDAAWSPDGRYMYVSADTGEGFHVWRQRFPNGEPEQVTSGATEEQGIAFAADGRSFVTSIGVLENTVWVHDERGDRQVTSQGYAYQPRFSPDRRRLYYLLRSGVSTTTWVSGELWVADLDSTNHKRLLSDFRIEDYEISPDGRQVVFEPVCADGDSPIWIAALDGRSPPRQLITGKATGMHFQRAVFGNDDDVLYSKNGALFRLPADGSAPPTKLDEDIMTLYSVSPDGKWAAVWKGRAVVIAPLDGGAPIQLCSLCGTIGGEQRGITPPIVTWSRGGEFIYVQSARDMRQTYAVPLAPGTAVPRVPPGGIDSTAGLAALDGARRLPEPRAFASDDPEVYAYMRATSRRNIYRVSVP
jgi:Tol biopolymer transport system component